MRFWLKQIKKKGKIIVHKTGQILFKPLWNYLPSSDLNDSLELVIILTKICNANCIFCTYQFLPIPERINMPDEIFGKIIKNIKKINIFSVHFTSNAGEPLIDSRFLEKIRQLRSAGMRCIKLTTNAILIDNFGIRRFLDDGPDIINISTTALDANMYKRIFRSDEFGRMRDNVMNLLNENKRRSKPRYITIGIRPDRPKDDVLAMSSTQSLIELADEVSISEEYGDWLGLVKDSVLTGNMKIEKPSPLSNRPCQVLITTPAVHPNGDILACACRNINNDPGMYLGNILETDLGTAFSSIDDIARNWRKGKIPKTCYLCTMYGDPSYYWTDYLRRPLFKMSNSLFRSRFKRQ